MDSTSTQSAQAAAESATSAATPEQRRSWMQGPLPEVIGYVGGALVASAGLNFIAQSWEKWSFITRVSVVGTALAILYAAAGAVIGIAGGRAALESPEKANRRRLTAVLMALAAVLVGALTAVIIDHQGWMDFEDSTWWIVLPGALALLAAGVGAWFAPGAVSTLAVAATSAWTGVALTMKIAVDQPGGCRCSSLPSAPCGWPLPPDCCGLLSSASLSAWRGCSSSWVRRPSPTWPTRPWALRMTRLLRCGSVGAC